MNVANITISNVDDQVKLNFERLCAKADMNMSAVFSALVQVGYGVSELGFFAKTNVAPALTLAQKQNEAFKQFSADMKAIDDEPIDEEFLAIVNSGVTIDSGVSL